MPPDTTAYSKDLFLRHFYEVLMSSLCARQYTDYKRRMEGAAPHRMSASCTSRLTLSRSFHAGK